MRDMDFAIDERPTGPARVALSPTLDGDRSKLAEVLQFAGAVAVGVLILTGRTVMRRPFASLVAIAFAWGAVNVGANLLSHSTPHPRPLFARQAEPVEALQARPQEPAREVLPPVATRPPEPPARDRRDIVRDLQAELTRRGHYQGTVDGLFGPRTERAIRLAEKEAGLPETGQPTEALLTRLTQATTPAPTISARPAATPAPQRTQAPMPPSRQTLVLVQRRLADMGYAPGPLNGDLTPEFRRAIERFRKDNDLAPSADVDQVFLNRLAVITGPLT